MSTFVLPSTGDLITPRAKAPIPLENLALGTLPTVKWTWYDSAGTTVTGTYTLNVSSTTDIGTGNYSCSFTNNIANDYRHRVASIDSLVSIVGQTVDSSVTGMEVYIWSGSGGGATDSNGSMVGFGGLA